MMLRAWLVFALLTTGGWVQAQSLAEVARAEAARRKTVDAPAKVYTNDDLKADFSKPSPAPPTTAAPAASETGVAKAAGAETTGAPAGGRESGPVRDQAYWAARMAEAQSRVERSRSFEQALQNRIDMLWTDFVNRDDPVQQRAIEQDRAKAIGELEQVKRETEESVKAVAAVEEEARRAGVPPGWLRP